jgi:zinc-binding alcohol dehydrogenase family protein
MKALAYVHAHALADFAIREVDIPAPAPRPHDLVVDVRAFSANPVDYKVRTSRSGTPESPIVLGWDGAGVVTSVGAEARGFAVGDEVYFAGDLTRAGTYAEQVAVDSRLVARKPATLDFARAAALPLTSLTAWEGLVDRGVSGTVLVIGGAGGVGSTAIQLLKTATSARVVATASRPETIAWCRELGADDVIDHRRVLDEQLAAIGLREVDVVFSTSHTDAQLPQITAVLRPFGHLVLIDDPPTFDIAPLKRKSLTISWELMFTKSLYGHRLESQGEILARVAALVDSGKLRSTLRTHLHGFSAENVRTAHQLLEAGTAIGKIVISRD